MNENLIYDLNVEFLERSDVEFDLFHKNYSIPIMSVKIMPIKKTVASMRWLKTHGTVNLSNRLNF